MSITGAAELAAELDRAAARAGPLADLLTRGAAVRVEERTEQTVAVATGRTKASVRVDRLGPADYSVGGTEEGTLRRLELGGSNGGAQPALYPAADAEGPGWERSLETVVEI